jgi:metal-responsive CopG/Arc/MetJ family transcriptional regulator
MKPVTILLETELLYKIEEAAERLGMTRPDLIRQILKEYFDG